MKTFWLQTLFFIIFIFVIIFPEKSEPAKEKKDVAPKASAVEAKAQNNVKLEAYNKKLEKDKKKTSYNKKKLNSKVKANKKPRLTEAIKNGKQAKIKSPQRIRLSSQKRKPDGNVKHYKHHKKVLHKKKLTAEADSGDGIKKVTAENDSGEGIKKVTAENDSGEGTKKVTAENDSGEGTKKVTAENDSGENTKKVTAENDSGEGTKKVTAENDSGENTKKVTAEDDSNDKKSHEHDTEGLAEAANSEPGFDLTSEDMQKFNIWPNATIPYYIDDFSFDKSLSGKMVHILDNINSRSGLKFNMYARAPDKDPRWVLFINRKGALNCDDYNYKSFTNQGVQRVVVGYDCLETPTWLSSVALALAGIPPQHNSPDRDKYITVSLENVIPEKRGMFEALKNDEWLFHDLSYDYQSASHYDSHQYSFNGSATIVPKGGVSAIPDENQHGLSFKDVEKLRMLYNYIAKKADSVRVGCNKLFRPGPGKFTPRNLPLKPRPKPRKYTGGADNNEVHAEDDKDHSQEIVKKEDDADSAEKIGEVTDIKAPKDINDFDVSNERQTSIHPFKLKRKVDVANLEDFNTSE